LRYLIPSNKYYICCIFFCITAYQNISAQSSYNKYTFFHSSLSEITYSDTTGSEENFSSFPEPKQVLFKSLMIPGWGQIQNKQIWKVPIIYGLLGGLTYYSITLTKDYHDYRAAFYNETRGEETDFRFGRTPPQLVGENTERLRSKRNTLRNRRDLSYIFIALGYALNAIDAYVYAHLRTFDVSDDLSMNANIKPDFISLPMTSVTPALSISIKLNKR